MIDRNAFLNQVSNTSPEVNEFVDAARSGKLEVVRQYIQQYEANPAFVNGHQSDCQVTALMAAASNGHLDVLAALLSIRGIDVNERDTVGNTAAMWAMQFGQMKAVEALIKSGKVDTQIENVNGKNLLALAIDTGKEDVVQMILDAPRYNSKPKEHSLAHCFFNKFSHAKDDAMEQKQSVPTYHRP